MGRKDIGLKSYLEDARRYADLWNGGVFGGRQILKPGELHEMNPVLVKADEEIVLERTRDIVMMQGSKGQRFAVFAVENQAEVDYGMPVRIMLQEALEYNRQIKAIMRNNRENGKKNIYYEGRGGRNYRDSGEFLYKIRKDDKLYPVITLIVYWGEEAWNGAKSLHEMICFEESDLLISSEIKKLVPEYPLHFLDLTTFHHFEYFKTELRPLMKLYQNRNNRKEFMEYLKSDEVNRKMDDESWYMLGQLTRSKKAAKLAARKNQEGNEEKDMQNVIDDVIDELINEGIKKRMEEGMQKRMEEGMQKGMEEGMQKGMEEGKIAGKAEDIIDLLEAQGEVPGNLKDQILTQRNLERLRQWLKLAAQVESVEDFFIEISKKEQII